MTLNEMRDILKAEGWVIYDGKGWGREWYACKSFVSAHWCESNRKRPQFVVWAYSMTRDFVTHESCEVEVTGAADGEWFKLSAYSMKPADFMTRKDYILEQLQRAWEAL